MAAHNEALERLVKDPERAGGKDPDQTATPSTEDTKILGIPKSQCRRFGMVGGLICLGVFCTIQAGFAFVLYVQLNNFQAWSVSHPYNPVSLLYQPYLNIVEGFWSMNPLYLDAQRAKYGNTFMCAGQVVLGEWEHVTTAVTSPQARTTKLGASPMIPSHLPHRANGELSFLLALSDKKAGGTGSHEAYKAAMVSVILTHATAARQADATSERLLEELAAEYTALLRQGEAGKTAFFTSPDQGLMRFNTRYLHYVLFGLSPDDSAAFDLFTQVYVTKGGPSYFLTGVGEFKFTTGGLLQQAKERYAASPAFATFQEDNPDFMHITKADLALALTGMMSIAAMQGPLQLALRALGYTPLPDYEGARVLGVQSPQAVDLLQRWDALDLEDDEALELYLTETARLYTPVSAVHRVSQEPITAAVAGATRTFPAGSVVNVPLSLASLDPAQWGPTRYDFNPQRPGLLENSLAFAELGNRSAGRGCPGRGVAMTMLSDLLRTLGRARRGAMQA